MNSIRLFFLLFLVNYEIENRKTKQNKKNKFGSSFFCFAFLFKFIVLCSDNLIIHLCIERWKKEQMSFIFRWKFYFDIEFNTNSLNYVWKLKMLNLKMKSFSSLCSNKFDWEWRKINHKLIKNQLNISIVYMKLM